MGVCYLRYVFRYTLSIVLFCPYAVRSSFFGDRMHLEHEFWTFIIESISSSIFSWITG